MKPAAALLLCLVAFSSHTQPVYRCGNEYSRLPCSQGKVIEVNDPRSTAQRAEARQVAADEQRRAAEMKHDRLAEQAAQKRTSAASLNAAPMPTAKPASAAERHPPKKKHATSKPSASTAFTATDPASKKQRSRNKP